MSAGNVFVLDGSLAEGLDRKIVLPTGYLFTTRCSKGSLETLSIGDYGKQKNVKADFLGLTRDLMGVENGECLPLSEKWVITLSTQYGCVMDCKFCDVPKIAWKGNASEEDLWRQFVVARNMFPNVGYAERLNIHFARMGEPIFNENVFSFARHAMEHKRVIQESLGLRIEVLHPVLTTSCPAGWSPFASKMREWADIKNDLYHGQAGLQISINTTDEERRKDMFSGKSLSLSEIAECCRTLPPPLGRKYCLNFALADDYVVDADVLASLFDPESFMVKITPIHNCTACRENGIMTTEGYSSFAPYSRVESELKAAGFDVLVFVPSIDEEDGLVTCGNAVLSGSEVRTDATVPLIQGL